MNTPFTTTAAAPLAPEEVLAIARAGGPDGWLAAALTLDDRLAEVARRPGDATLTRLRLAWWRDAVERVTESAAVDPVLIRLAPHLRADAVQRGRIEAVLSGWDDRAGETPTAALDLALSGARARLLLDGAACELAERALTGRALAQIGAPDAASLLEEGLASRWPTRLRGHRLLARAALHRLSGRSERALSLRLIGWSLTGA